MELEEEPIPLPLLYQLLYEAETGNLDNLTQEGINKVLSAYMLNRYSKNEAPRSVKEISESLISFLSKISNFFSVPERKIKSIYDLKEKVEKLEAALPKGCELWDDDEVINFAKKLDKPYYNDSQAGVLLGVQRQTVKDWKDKKYHGLVGYVEKNRNVISRDNLLKFYRVWKGKEWNF
jgi:hypothetical protein